MNRTRSTSLVLLLLTAAGYNAVADVSIQSFDNYTTGGNIAAFADPSAVITPGPTSWTVDLTGVSLPNYFGMHWDSVPSLDLSAETELVLDFTINPGSADTYATVVLDTGGNQNVYQSPSLGVGNHQFSISLSNPTNTVGSGADLSDVEFFQVQANSAGGTSPYSISFNDLLATSGGSGGGPIAVTKTNPQKVFMHYMPWFESPATLGGSDWGWHWEMNTRDPNVVDADGRRQIASHFYPLIGPYASSDPDVVEYHLLLMKYAGVDGVLIDWYGQQGSNGDVTRLLNNSNALINQTDDVGIEFGVEFEDRFARNINDARANMAYLRDNYFNKPNYIRTGPDDDPLVTVFGPITFETEAEWTSILSQAGEDVDLLPLWYEYSNAGAANADGEHSWVYEDEAQDNFLAHLENFYATRATLLDRVGGSAFPGFVDYYQEGGAGTSISFEIPHDDGQTLADTLALADEYSETLDFLQLVTWNDFGEGTIFEPTVEAGFDYLVQVQQFTGVAYGEAELQLIYDLYRARKDFSGTGPTQALLDQAAEHLAALEVEEARAILDAIFVPGDFDGDGDTDVGDLLVWQRQFGMTGLWPLSKLEADANADGVVDFDDLAFWRSGMATLTANAAATGLLVPEPSSAPLVLLAGVTFLTSWYRR